MGRGQRRPSGSVGFDSAMGAGVVAAVAGVVLVFALLQGAELRARTRNRRDTTMARSAG